ncbi:MAG TPA: dienelactone hydrolase family protein [Leptospiraceae bacterium]|jgi:dienelactone hydrolase|nr:dienelactone hydrolase family protein [Leptospiraceae bacterium]HMW59217.1 dienelactone hydrolase family protein [Leptospiraceae bacterium]HMX55481.1 dienelactone hydrolase family protein [Leptospiraceae bacterium]HMY43847.1 dienelactone hydrolase family protein [Leptospiraceae bacterium]HMZ35375.1 dienelactone hydrolase family protein [Leptospiraceae bacterium]
MKRTLLALLLVFAFVACQKNHVRGEEVTYKFGDQTLKGLLAYAPEQTGKRPAVLVVHEWWGNNDYSRKRAMQLAELGYVALAIDMYGDGKIAANPDEAGKMAGGVMKDFEKGKGRFAAALDFVKQQPQVDPTRIAAIGYCFGGGVVLNMARQGADLKGVVSFHGGLDPVKPAKKGEVKARILVAHGGADSFVPMEKVDAIKKEMSEAGADLTVTVYPGATHVFTNPDADKYAKEFKMPIAYNAEADKKSWEEMANFLSSVLK